MSDEEREALARKPAIPAVPTTFKAKRTKFSAYSPQRRQSAFEMQLPSDPKAWFFAVVEVAREDQANLGPFYVIFTPAAYFTDNRKQIDVPVLFAINDHLPAWMGHEIGPGTFILTDIEEMPTRWHTVVQELTRRGFVFDQNFAHTAEPHHEV